MTKEQIIVALIAVARAAHELADGACDEDDIITIEPGVHPATISLINTKFNTL